MPRETTAAALKASARDPQAFEQFYDVHASQLLAYIARRVYDADLAMDLTSEVFAKAYIGRRAFRGSTDREAAGWLYKIADRQIGRYFKKASVERKALARLGVEPPSLDDEQRARVEDLADLARLRRGVHQALTSLPEPQREALRLRVIDELPYSDVARRLGITEQTARSRVSRGLRGLAARLHNNCQTKETMA